MRKQKAFKLFHVFCLLWLFVFVQGCTDIPSGTILQTPSERGIVQPTQYQTKTSIPGRTIIPELSPSPEFTSTSEPTRTNTQTITPSPFPDCSGVEVVGFGLVDSETIFFSFDGFPIESLGNTIVMVSDLLFSCEDVEEVPGRIYCEGPAFPPGTGLFIKLLIDGHLVWTGDYKIPYPTITPTVDPQISGISYCKAGYTKKKVDPMVLSVPGFPKKALDYCASTRIRCWDDCPPGELSMPVTGMDCLCVYPLFSR